MIGGTRGPGRLLRLLFSPVLGLAGCLVKTGITIIIILLVLAYSIQHVMAPIGRSLPKWDSLPLPLPTRQAGPVAHSFDYPVGRAGADGHISGDGWRVSQDFQDVINAYSQTLSGQHLGEDWTAPGCAGQPVYAIADGLVIRSEKNKSYGHLVMIRHPLPRGGDFSCVVSFYGHLGSQHLPPPPDGDNFHEVRRGDIIGYVGRQGENGVDHSGKSWASHLHFELRADSDHTGHVDDYINKGYSTERRGYLNPSDATSKGNEPGGGWIDRHR